MTQTVQLKPHDDRTVETITMSGPSAVETIATAFRSLWARITGRRQRSKDEDRRSFLRPVVKVR